MDTLMNSISGPYIQTFIFENTSYMIGFIHQEKTNISMSKIFNVLEDKLGYRLFRKLFLLILTDRGSEFAKSEIFQFNNETGELRLQIFYCAAMQDAQKPHVENNHNYIRDIIIRDIIPNEVDITNIKQDDLELMFSHINSTPRAIYNGRTPYEMFEFLHSKDFDTIITAFNIKKIKREEVVLKLYLLKHIYKQK